MKLGFLFTLLMFCCQSILGAEENFSGDNDCGCSAFASQVKPTKKLSIDLPECPCKQLPYLTKTFADVVQEPMVKYKNAFLTLIWGLKDPIEEKQGKLSLANHNKNISFTYSQFERYKENYAEQLYCMLCPLVKHFKYAQLTRHDYENFCGKHNDSIAVFGGIDMLGDMIYLNADQKEIAKILLDRSAQ